MFGNVSLIDTAIAAAYLIGIVAVGTYVGARHNKKRADAENYFLAGGSLRWPMIGLALFATNISCVHLVSLAQAGYQSGLLMGNFEWMAAFTLIALSLFFAPFYIRSKIATLPDFLEQRYCRASRDWLAVLSLVSAVVVHIGFAFLTGGLVLQALFGIESIYTAILIIAALTAVYTMVGGLVAVVVTESIETVVLIAGAIMITLFALNRIGGWENLLITLEANDAAHFMSVLRGSGDPGGDVLPWWSVLLGYPVIGLWYWCADQTIVQRVLGARDENHARIGPLFAALIKILPVFIFVLPGTIAFALAQTGALDLSAAMDVVDGQAILNDKKMYAAMILDLLPTGLVGIMIAALIAALMSTVSGAFNSIATLVSYDLYKRFKADATDRELVFVGRITVGIALIVAVALVPLLNTYNSLFAGINDIIAHIAPPVTCVFFLGVFWPAASACSAKWTLWIGSLLGMAVFAINKLWANSPLGDIPFLLMAFLLFCICILIQVACTIAFPKEAHEDPKNLHWKTLLEPITHKGWNGIGDYRILSVLIILAMAALYYAFA